MKVNKIKDVRFLLVVILTIFLIILIFITPNFKEKRSFEIEDKCGRFMNLMSHTIQDESACKSRCKSQCETIDYKYDDVDFKSSNSDCNYCMCYCK